MYVVIDGTTYTEISNLDFEPESDVTGSSVPINELWVSIKTNDSIALSKRVNLYDDLDNLWASYWIVYAEREDAYTVRVHGQSDLSRLEGITLDPIMYNNTSVTSALSTVLSALSDAYTIDQSFANQTLTGFCPKQSARVRLQWICMVLGAYLKNYFNEHLEILPIDDVSEIVIPVNKTYWKPTVTYKDYVTAVRVTYYSYTQGLPSRTDEYVEANDVTYIQNSTEVTLTNNDLPEGVTENVVTLEDVTLVNSENVSEVLSFIAKYKFQRTELDLEAIDNGEYMPAQRVYAFADEDTMYEGYINSCSFTFGLQAKASIHMTPTEVRESALLTILYKWGDKQVAVRLYRFPASTRDLRADSRERSSLTSADSPMTWRMRLALLFLPHHKRRGEAQRELLVRQESLSSSTWCWS